MKRLRITITLLSLLVIQMGLSQRQVQKWDLDSCINYAMKQNIQIKKSKIALEEIREDTKTTRAAMFPSLSFSSSHSLVATPLNNVGEGSRSSYSGNYGFNSELTVYDGGKLCIDRVFSGEIPAGSTRFK